MIRVRTSHMEPPPIDDAQLRMRIQGHIDDVALRRVAPSIRTVDGDHVRTFNLRNRAGHTDMRTMSITMPIEAVDDLDVDQGADAHAPTLAILRLALPALARPIAASDDRPVLAPCRRLVDDLAILLRPHVGARCLVGVGTATPFGPARVTCARRRPCAIPQDVQDAYGMIAAWAARRGGDAAHIPLSLGGFTEMAMTPDEVGIVDVLRVAAAPGVGDLVDAVAQADRNQK